MDGAGAGYGARGPLVDVSRAAFVHPSALLYGRVTMGEGSSVWPHAVMRAEAAHIEIGACSNIQDFVMLHTDPGRPVIIGAHCSITHHATIHGSTIGDHVLVGINATIYGGSHIGSGSIVGQHAYVKDGTMVPENSVVVGAPAKAIRTGDHCAANRLNALLYHRNALAYARGDHRAWEGPEFERWLAETLEALEAERRSRQEPAP